MNALGEQLKRHIRQSGPMDTGSFMGRVVTHYYSHNAPFGADGDFTTAPEISQMFGEMIGIWVADIWIKLGQPRRFTLIEAGPGRGTLMADLLRGTKNISGLHEAMDILLIENSPSLTERQKQTLSGYDAAWSEHIDFEAVSAKGQPVVIIGNEFFDALPVRQIMMTADKGWQERVIALDEKGGFTFGLAPVSKDVPDMLPDDAQDGDIYEISPVRNSFMENIAQLIRHCGGAGLFFDYGYDSGGPVKGDTLQAVKKHEFVPVLSHIGTADLTAHVDFSALKSAAAGQGAVCYGAAGQGAFLQNMGLDMRAQMLAENAAPAQRDAIKAAKDRLCAPQEMGTLFRVIAVTHDETLVPAGFDE